MRWLWHVLMHYERVLVLAEGIDGQIFAEERCARCARLWAPREVIAAGRRSRREP
jgi:hypothetical protein